MCLSCPIIEFVKGPLLLTFNPLFTKQVGTFADQEGLSSTLDGEPSTTSIGAGASESRCLARSI